MIPDEVARLRAEVATLRGRLNEDQGVEYRTEKDDLRDKARRLEVANESLKDAIDGTRIERVSLRTEVARLKAENKNMRDHMLDSAELSAALEGEMKCPACDGRTVYLSGLAVVCPACLRAEVKRLRKANESSLQGGCDLDDVTAAVARQTGVIDGIEDANRILRAEVEKLEKVGKAEADVSRLKDVSGGEGLLRALCAKYVGTEIERQSPALGDIATALTVHVDRITNELEEIKANYLSAQSSTVQESGEGNE